MSSVISVVFVLTGPLAGKTVNLGKTKVFPFRNGRLIINASTEEIALYGRFLERNWQAYPEGHPKLEVESGKRNIQADTELNEQHAVLGRVQPSGEGTQASEQASDKRPRSTAPDGGSPGVLPDRDGHTAELNERLLKAVRKLDPENDAHWTQDGKPAMSAVERLYGSGDVTRAVVDEVAPGYNRKSAKEKRDGVRE